IAPAGVTPNFRLGAQALHFGVEPLDQKIAGDLLVVDADHAVDRRLLDLDHRAAGVRQLVQLFIHGAGERHHELAPVAVVAIVDAGREHLPGDGAELHRLSRHALRDLPDARVFERAAPHFAGDVRQYARFQHLEHYVARRLVAARRRAPAPDV